jgi:hypothetical protein
MRRKERRGDPIDPNELKVLSERSPVKVWVNLLLLHMYKDSVSSLVLQKSKGIPPIPLEEEVPPGGFDFDKIINRLKVMSNLDPIACPKPCQGEFPLMIQGVPYTVSTTFVDTGADPRCEITMRKGKPRSSTA